VSRLAAAVVGVVLLAAGCAESEPAVEDNTEFCTELRRAAGPSGALQRLDDLGDPDSVDAAVDELRGLVELAPSPVRDDVVTAITGFEDLITALEAPDNRSPAEVLAELEQPVNVAGEAAARLDAYARSQCGIVLNPTPTPTPEADTTEEDLRPA